MTDHTFIGVGVLVVRDGCLLLGRRRGSHGAATWAPPGGHLEAGESVGACAQRELREETAMHAVAWHEGPFALSEFPERDRRYVTLFVIVTDAHGDAHNCEPDKCDGWEWHHFDRLPEPLFAPLASIVARGWTPEVRGLVGAV